MIKERWRLPLAEDCRRSTDDGAEDGDGQAGIYPANVTTCLCGLGTTANSPTYARIVATMARYRRILQAADELTHAVRAFDDTAIDQALDALGKERQ